MENLIYVDGQSVTLLNGENAYIEVKYDKNKKLFIVTADCESWANSFLSYMEGLYTYEAIMGIIREARDVCKYISGEYSTLAELNQIMENCCIPEDWHEVSWK